MAAKLAYRMAGVEDPRKELDFVELHDAYSSSEIQTYEDLGLSRYGEGGGFVEAGYPFMPDIDYGLEFSKGAPGTGTRKIPVNPSGGLLACGHPVGATGLMQAVLALWQLQGTIKKHLGNDTLQIKDAKRGLIHSHAGTGTYITATVMERV
jgi:acetyl-CoA C-acetyltransferase